MDEIVRMEAGFIGLCFAQGFREVLHHSEFKKVRPRIEGGTRIELADRRLLLTSCSYKDVVAALAHAKGETDAA